MCIDEDSVKLAYESACAYQKSYILSYNPVLFVSIFVMFSNLKTLTKVHCNLLSTPILLDSLSGSLLLHDTQVTQNSNTVGWGC